MLLFTKGKIKTNMVMVIHGGAAGSAIIDRQPGSLVTLAGVEVVPRQVRINIIMPFQKFEGQYGTSL